MKLGRAASAAVAIGLLVLPSAPSRAEDTAWHTIAGPDKSFTAELPAEPKYTPTKLKPQGAAVTYTMHQYLVEDEQRAFIVQSIVYPKAVILPTPRATLENGLNNTAKGMEGGKWASVDWLQHEGLTAVDAVGARDGQEVRSFQVIKDQQVFTLIYAGPPGTSKSGDAARFMASLHIAK